MPTERGSLYVAISPSRVAVWLALGLSGWAVVGSLVLVAARALG